MKPMFCEIPVLKDDRIRLRKVTGSDLKELEELVNSSKVYRYLPTFLFEKQYRDMHIMIGALYEDLFQKKESLILGISTKENDELCGLAEFYGFKDSIHKISIGYRLLEKHWGKGIASAAVALMIDYLYSSTDIEIITASTMVENTASRRVLEKNGFIQTTIAEEDWGYEKPVTVNKWFY
ncbi:MAG: GNAT family N-acetyltransferase [Erysipelotrichaceae bacterium]|nr:GNAT family N-acetyltransferase [Erysipelotrichaceae bacterium]